MMRISGRLSVVGLLCLAVAAGGALAAMDDPPPVSSAEKSVTSEHRTAQAIRAELRAIAEAPSDEEVIARYLAFLEGRGTGVVLSKGGTVPVASGYGFEQQATTSRHWCFRSATGQACRLPREAGVALVDERGIHTVLSAKQLRAGGVIVSTADRLAIVSLDRLRLLPLAGFGGSAQPDVPAGDGE
jgi:hypothetical protein